MQPLINVTVLGLIAAGLYALHQCGLRHFGPHRMDMIRSALLLAFMLLGGCYAWR